MHPWETHIIGTPASMSQSFATTTASIMAVQIPMLLSTMQQTMVSFRAELQWDQEETGEGCQKSLPCSRSDFCCKGNEKQHCFIEAIQEKVTVALQLEKLNSASTSTSRPTTTSVTSSASFLRAPGLVTSLEQARTVVKEGIELLKSCQKAIHLADRSNLGWAVVNEHGKDKLADDLDDEKRMVRAVVAAEKKAAQQKKEKTGPEAMIQNRPDAAFRPLAPMLTLDTRYPGCHSMLVRVSVVARWTTVSFR